MSKAMFDQSAAQFAANTDSVMASNGYVRGQLFVDALARRLSKGARVLDFGCGPGRISLLAADAGFSVDGVDSSTGMIAEASKLPNNGKPLRFRECDGIGNDLETGVYDGVVCSSVIEYVPESEKLLANFHRATKDGGTLAISYCNKTSLWRAYTRRTQAHKPHFTAQVNIWSYGEFRDRLQAAGFDVISGPVFLEASPFDKRPKLRFLSSYALFGTLGFVVAKKRSGGP